LQHACGHYMLPAIGGSQKQSGGGPAWSTPGVPRGIPRIPPGVPPENLRGTPRVPKGYPRYLRDVPSGFPGDLQQHRQQCLQQQSSSKGRNSSSPAGWGHCVEKLDPSLGPETPPPSNAIISGIPGATHKIDHGVGKSVIPTRAMKQHEQAWNRSIPTCFDAIFSKEDQPNDG
jgi:hypothetical protein